jgi:hypothetical protein
MAAEKRAHDLYREQRTLLTATRRRAAGGRPNDTAGRQIDFDEAGAFKPIADEE